MLFAFGYVRRWRASRRERCNSRATAYNSHLSSRIWAHAPGRPPATRKSVVGLRSAVGRSSRGAGTTAQDPPSRPLRDSCNVIPATIRPLEIHGDWRWWRKEGRFCSWFELPALPLPLRSILSFSHNEHRLLVPREPRSHTDPLVRVPPSCSLGDEGCCSRHVVGRQCSCCRRLVLNPAHCTRAFYETPTAWIVISRI